MTLQDKFNKANHIYKITKDIDLGGETLNIPAGCTLDFQGGSFSNGTINGNGTILKGSSNCIALNVILTGTWDSQAAYSNWFSIKNDCVLDDNLNYVEGTDNKQGFINLIKFTEIHILSGCYYTTYTKFTLLNGTHLYGNNAIIKGKFLNKYNGIIYPGNNNIIENLTLIGNKNETNEVTEWASGLDIRFNNIHIINVKCVLFRGDGLYISNATNITIDNCIFDRNHRQGLSIIHGSDIIIRNCKFINTSGTAPQFGIDLEPNSESEFVKNVTIENCEFSGNVGGGISVVSHAFDNNTNIENIRINNCTFRNNRIDLYSCKHLHITNCIFLASRIYFLADLGDNLLYCNDVNIDNCFMTGVKNTAYSDFLILNGGEKVKRYNISITNNILKYSDSYSIFITPNCDIDGLIIKDNYLSNVHHGIVVWPGPKNVVYSGNIIANHDLDNNGNKYVSNTPGIIFRKEDDISTRNDSDISLTKEGIHEGYIQIGTSVYDTTLNKPIWWTGSKWVDATGADV